MPYTYYRGNFYYVPTEEKTFQPKRVYDKEMRQLLSDRRKVEKSLKDPANNEAMINVLKRHLFVIESKISKIEASLKELRQSKYINYE